MFPLMEQQTRNLDVCVFREHGCQELCTALSYALLFLKVFIYESELYPFPIFRPSRKCSRDERGRVKLQLQVMALLGNKNSLPRKKKGERPVRYKERKFLWIKY